jgi:hypothetical protein
VLRLHRISVNVVTRIVLNTIRVSVERPRAGHPSVFGQIRPDAPDGDEEASAV